MYLIKFKEQRTSIRCVCNRYIGRIELLIDLFLTDKYNKFEEKSYKIC